MRLRSAEFFRMLYLPQSIVIAESCLAMIAPLLISCHWLYLLLPTGKRRKFALVFHVV
jgi:hypothetical protein